MNHGITLTSTLTATLQVQVVPSYQGEWSGTTMMTSCTDLADFQNGAYCAPRLGRSRLSGQTPHELFAAYLENVSVDDSRLTALFAELLDEVTETRA